MITHSKRILTHKNLCNCSQPCCGQVVCLQSGLYFCSELLKLSLIVVDFCPERMLFVCKAHKCVEWLSASLDQLSTELYEVTGGVQVLLDHQIEFQLGLAEQFS